VAVAGSACSRGGGTWILCLSAVAALSSSAAVAVCRACSMAVLVLTMAALALVSMSAALALTSVAALLASRAVLAATRSCSTAKSMGSGWQRELGLLGTKASRGTNRSNETGMSKVFRH
jgi:hypothetical protein